MRDTEKPNPLATSPRTRLLFAALLWTIVGTALLTVGIWWTMEARRLVTLLLLPPALILGLAKARWILARVAGQNVLRVLQQSSNQWIGGFMPVRLWLAIAFMVIAGNLLRRYVLPLDIVGLIYIAVGGALLISARIIWTGWHSSRGPGLVD
jgi:hypothetical protein